MTADRDPDRRARVLVLDDSATSLAIAAKLLGDSYLVRTTTEPLEALKLLKEEGFELLFLDLLMPAMDGRQVLRLVKEGGIKTPVVIMTADIQEKTLASLIELGAHSVINKPLTRAKLLEAAESAIKGAAEERP